MKTNFLKSAAGIGLLLIAQACNKTELASEMNEAAGADTPGLAKASVPVFQMNNGSGTRSMNVASGCNGSIGTISLNPPSYQSLKDAGTTPSVLKVTGFHKGTCSSPMSLNAGSTPGATGPLYYIIPNQGGGSYGARSMLKLWVKNTNWPSNHNGAFLTYNASTNAWSFASDASTYFTWQVITGSALPQFTCTYLPCGGEED